MAGGERRAINARRYALRSIRWLSALLCAAALGVGVVCLAAALAPPANRVALARYDTSIMVMPDDEGALNLNTAGQIQLEALPGIGPVIARRIIEYRKLVDGFTDETELIRIKGIGDVISSKLYPLVYVRE